MTLQVNTSNKNIKVCLISYQFVDRVVQICDFNFKTLSFSTSGGVVQKEVPTLIELKHGFQMSGRQLFERGKTVSKSEFTTTLKLQFTSKVVSCEKSEFNRTVNGKNEKIAGYEVILENTVLFPEGGGQVLHFFPQTFY